MENIFKHMESREVSYIFFFFFSVVDTALNGITYKPSFKGYLIQANAIEKLGGFFKNR